MRGLGLVVAASLLVVPAGAATLCVNPTGAGGCATTIQAAVNAAAAGDLISVQPGEYFENVVVPAGKDGLQLVGANKLTTILDPDVPNAGTAIMVNSNSVTVRNLTIRNGQNGGIYVNGGYALIQSVRVVGMRDGYGLSFARSTFGHRVLSNEIRGVALGGIYLPGDNAGSLIQGNLVTQTNGFGVYAVGLAVQVSANRVYGTAAGAYGIAVAGALVTANLVEQGAGQYGLYVLGDGLVVRGNRVTHAGPLAVNCASCTTGSVVANSNVGSSTFGMELSSTGPGLVAQGNSVASSAGPGFRVSGTDVQLTQNFLTEVGFGASGHGFEVTGGDHVLTRNTATRCGASGFFVLGNDITLDTNVAVAAGVSGFLVDGNGGVYARAILARNTALSNNGQGFAVIGGAVSTVFALNTATKHRVDFCDEGTGTDTSMGNTFGTTSSSCDILD